MKNLISYKIFENAPNFKFNIGDEVVCIKYGKKIFTTELEYNLNKYNI